MDSLGATVTNSLGATVTTTVIGDYNPDSLGNIKFVIQYNTNKIGFAKFSNANLLDWEDLSAPGVSYESYFITGPRVRGEGQRKFQETYITVFSRYKANSSCWMHSIWDYGNNLNSNRWGTPQQVLAPNSSFDYTTVG